MSYNKLNKTKETKQEEREVQSIENVAYYLKQNLSKGGTDRRRHDSYSDKLTEGGTVQRKRNCIRF